LNKLAGNLANVDAATRQAAQDANLDAIDAFLGSLVGVAVASTSGAIAIKEGSVLITDAGAAAMTLAAPTPGARSAGGDDGKKLRILATTAYAHTVTTPPGKINGNRDVVTFAAVGDCAELTAYNGVWYATLSGPTPAALSEV
jgi:hypothetical protein